MAEGRKTRVLVVDDNTDAADTLGIEPDTDDLQEGAAEEEDARDEGDDERTPGSTGPMQQMSLDRGFSGLDVTSDAAVEARAAGRPMQVDGVNVEAPFLMTGSWGAAS